MVDIKETINININKETRVTDLMNEKQIDYTKIDVDFQYYREKIATLSGVIVTLSSAILALILKDSKEMPNIVRDELTAKLLWVCAILFIFLSVIFSLLAIFYIIRGYYFQANQRIGQNLGNPTPSFDKADKLVVCGLKLFLTGFVIGFFIFAIEYFSSLFG